MLRLSSSRAAASLSRFGVRTLALGALAGTLLAAPPAGAIPKDPIEPPPSCLASLRGTISATPAALTTGETTAISWRSSGVKGVCSVVVSGPGLYQRAPSGSQTVMPVPTDPSNQYAIYTLKGFGNGLVQTLDTVQVKINLPPPVYGRSTVHIDWDTQAGLFVRAIGTANTTVVLADDLNLDLSGQVVDIAPGVHIVGGRSPTTPGPRLFSTSKPVPLFRIGQYLNADGVRITGIRLDGGDMGISDDDDAPIGISVNSSVNVEIGNNEIYGWSGIAVQVIDERGRINLDNATAVWVHDNYIHHNRHWRHEGYGIQSNVSAYTLIERNVFDYNRHALEASGTDGIGYLAYNNLLLEHGGENFDYLIGTQYTHQFDVHGTESCGNKDAYCGQAGEYFDYRYNTLTYVRGDDLKVRGRPTNRTDVTQNVFADPLYPLPILGLAITQTEGNNLRQWNNTFLHVPTQRTGACDFDGDGLRDDFMTTGETWWYRSATGHWHYLNTSSRMIGELGFADVSGDGRCDVAVHGERTVFSGGRTRWSPSGRAEAPARRTDLVWQAGAGGGGARLWHVDNGVLVGDVAVNDVTTPDSLVLGGGDFNGDGATDLLRRSGPGQISVSLLDQAGAVIDPLGSRSSVKGTLPLATQLAGIGDFNGDGRSDVLWRHADGQLEIWFAAEKGNSALVTWLNTTDGNGAPSPAPVPVAWKVKGVADFDGDGCSDILWRSDNGLVSIWYMKHAMHVAEVYPGDPDPSRWEIHGVADFDGDKNADILWRASTGELTMWFRGQYQYGQALPTWQNRPGWVTGPDWQVGAVGDFNGDGQSDILWRDPGGAVVIWMMNGGQYVGESAALPIAAWQLRGLLPQAVQRIDLQ